MNNMFGRRDFFKFAGVTFALTACDKIPRFSLFGDGLPEQEFIYSGYRVGEAFDSTNAGLMIKGPGLEKRVQLRNEIHSITCSKEHDLKIFVPKLDLVSYYQFGDDGEYIPLEATEGNYFYGHAAIDDKRKLVYFAKAKITPTRGDQERRDEPGYIHMYSIPDMKYVGKFPTFGQDPHDMMLVDDKILVCNGGSNSSVTVVDPEKKTLISKFERPDGLDHISLRHIHHIEGDNFLIAPLTRNNNFPCPPYLLNLKTGLKNIGINESKEFQMATMRFQILNLISHEGYIYGACPATHTVLVWDRIGKFIGGIEIKAICSLTISRKFGGVIAGSGERTEPARLIKIKENKISFEMLEWGTGIMGSHSFILES